ncbi:hypothetical protein JK227_19900 [Providencia rettgeri]|nr:hypothetical protein [Providencia rettgeri]
MRILTVYLISCDLSRIDLGISLSPYSSAIVIISLYGLANGPTTTVMFCLSASSGVSFMVSTVIISATFNAAPVQGKCLIKSSGSSITYTSLVELISTISS